MNDARVEAEMELPVRDHAGHRGWTVLLALLLSFVVLGAVATVGILVTRGGGGGTTPPNNGVLQSPSPTANASPSPWPSPSPTPAPAPTPTATTAPNQGWPITGGTDTRAAITDIRVGTHPGYDRLVIEFSGQDIPPFRIEPHDISTFLGDFSGAPISVDGKAALRVHLDNQDSPASFPHGARLTPGYSELKEVVVLGDFEGVANVAIGLDHLEYPTVTVIGSPTRLVIDFATGP